MPYIKGPAIVKRGGVSFYFADGLTVNVDRRTNSSRSDFHGEINKFLTSTLVTISGTPAPLIANLASFFGLGVSDVGSSIFGTSDTALEIWSKTEGKKYTWARSGLMQAPGLTLSATKDFFSGQIQWACLGGSETEATSASHWKAEASTTFSDTTFDPSKNKRYRYTAAWGSGVSYTDFAAMTAQEGFAIEVQYETSEVMDDNVGVGDIDLVSLTAGVRFIPSNLTEAQIHKLIRLQDTTAMLPGDTIGEADLTISGTDASTGFEAVIHNVGFTNSQLQYATGKLRAGEVVGVTSRTFTAGAADPLWTFTVS